MQEQQKCGPVIYTGKQLVSLEIPEHEWIIEGLLRTNRRRPSALAGKPGSGKSSLAWQMAADVARGATFLGRQTTPCEVLFIQSEEMPEECGEILRELDYDWSRDKTIDILDVNFCGQTLDARLKTLAYFLEEHPDVRLVIIETLDDFLQIPDIKENSASRDTFQRFDSVVMEKYAKQASFLMLHHLKKREVDQSGDALLGATVLNGRTDVKVYLKKISDDDPRRIIHSSKRRGGTAIEKTYLDFDRRTGRSTLGQTLANERKQKAGITAEKTESQILDFFVNHPFATETECLDCIEGNGDAKRRAFKALRRKGRLQESGKGVKGDPHVYTLAVIPTEERKAA
jgi:hypothetical protein